MRLISRRAFLRSLAAGAVFVGGGPLLYATTIEPNSVEIVEQTIRLPGLGAGFEGFRVVQISDLHAGLWMERSLLAKIITLAIDQKTDVALLTGDYLTKGGDTTQGASDLISTLRPLTAAMPVLAVRGNHDHGSRESTLGEVFAQTGIIELANSIQTVHRGGDMLHIAGIDSVSTGHQALGKVERSAPTNAPVILLAHEPDMVDYSSKNGKFAMQISGHSHGGQVKLPIIGYMALPWMGQKYPSGLYRVGKMWHYTNRGIGMTHLPFRINCRPEITVYTFLPA